MQVDIENIPWDQVKSGLLLVRVSGEGMEKNAGVVKSSLENFGKELKKNCGEEVRVLVAMGDITVDVISEKEMNRMGWYKFNHGLTLPAPKIIAGSVSVPYPDGIKD